VTSTGVELQPHLTQHRPRRTTTGVALLLHGLVRSPDPLDARSPSWLRMRLMAAQVRGALTRDGIAVWLLRYRFGGWGDDTRFPSPVGDARWALGRIREELGGVPVVLVGHSMGGRTAVAVADDLHVRGVVALAPWLGPRDPVATLRGRHLLAAHGRKDRVTSAEATRAYVARASRTTLTSECIDMGPRGHTMLPGAAAWNRVAVDATRRFLDGPTP
jgi:pimeloyl-ACP methyl ester carboxylesterase